uniref:DNA-directed RNA polymerase n=1 Tax=Noctiluca scintillans TaxID=2966 RepID=A0A7S1AEZ9_NOCSC
MEIVVILPSWKHLFPGLFLFLGMGRLVRPTRSVATGKTEFIGPLEQLFLNIAVTEGELQDAHRMLEDKSSLESPEQLPVKYTHREVKPTWVLSHLAALTPFSNHNQSPRNMYQCQMLKQTMGTPFHNHNFRTDNKVYRILNPQKPLLRTDMYNEAGFDLHPSGTNAIVAVVTYTGYDMEDAMIINKASYERGFKQGAVYKTKIIDAAPKEVSGESRKRYYFSNIRPVKRGEDVQRVCTVVNDMNVYKLGDDGVPAIGTYLLHGDPLYCVINSESGTAKVHNHEDQEPAYVEQVTWCDNLGSRRVSIRIRMVRNPVVGDKFASRHGQKGVMSILWPQEDMPFTETGITPDILFNPHGFPSRMTIGMLIESIGGKAAAVEGNSTGNCTTFRQYEGHYDGENNEKDSFLDKGRSRPPPQGPGPEAAEYFGRTLLRHGFQRLGQERMYSGIHGTELETDIFIGVVYYQRLRHMVAEKAQVRARGPIDKVTNQPVKGRARHGGIRFGEMERDSLLAHGAAFLLHDRLMRSSDYDIGFVCPLCGSVISPQASAYRQTTLATKRPQRGEPWECPPCTRKLKKPVRCDPVPIPVVFRYLACEMASMNVKIQINLADRAREVSLSSLQIKDERPVKIEKRTRGA